MWNAWEMRMNGKVEKDSSGNWITMYKKDRETLYISTCWVLLLLCRICIYSFCNIGMA